MTPHTRFRSFMCGADFDRPPLQELPPWEATVSAWMQATGQSREEILYWERECDAEENPGVDFSMRPPFAEHIVCQDEETVTRTDAMGLTYREFKDDPGRSMPQYIAHPVGSLEDWRKIKRRFVPSAGRYPRDWPLRVERWRSDGPILRLYGWVAPYFGGPSLYGFARMLMGTENLSCAFYDQPRLVHDMLDTMTEFTISVFDKALREAPVTLVQFWEDMCYNRGPLLSPRLFKVFLLDRYRKITRAIREAGVEIILLDCDGRVEELIPLWLEGGINGLFPMEQAAGNNLLEYRRRYGRHLLMSGGIDKRALARGREAIDQELAVKIPLALEGGYVPTVDHGIPPDVSFESFRYYWERKKQMLGIKNVKPSARHFFW